MYSVDVLSSEGLTCDESFVERVVLRRLSTVSCGYEGWADLSGLAYQTGRLRVPIVLLDALLLVCRSSRSPAGKADSDVSCEDLDPLMLVRFPRDYRDSVAECVRVKQVDAKPIAD